MTTVILVGGEEFDTNDCIDRLANEIALRDNNPTILSCHFAEGDFDGELDPDAHWVQIFLQYIPRCTIVKAIKEKFYDQVACADVVYLHGGSTEILTEVLSDFSRVRQILRDKIIIGSSAGANYLANMGYSPNARKIVRGSQIVDVSTIVHWGAANFANSDGWKKILADMQERAQSDITCLAEGEFVVIEVKD